MTVEVCRDVMDALEEIREDGPCNMLDFHCVQREAHERGRHALVVWIEENKKLYAEGVFAGFEVVGDAAGATSLASGSMDEKGD